MRNAHSARISISIAMLLLGGAFFVAEALTPQQCAANYQVAIAQANAQLQTAIRNCITTTAAGTARAACLKASVDTHQATLATDLATLRTCLRG
jgi:hypothetical protein